MGLSLPALESECGLDSAGASALQGGAELMHEATHAVNRAMIGVRTVLECKTFNPIYTTFVHDGECVHLRRMHHIFCALVFANLSSRSFLPQRFVWTQWTD